MQRESQRHQYFCFHLLFLFANVEDKRFKERTYRAEEKVNIKAKKSGNFAMSERSMFRKSPFLI